jgi:hypothetical protein
LSDAIFNELEGHRDAGPIIDAGEEGHAVVRSEFEGNIEPADAEPERKRAD